MIYRNKAFFNYDKIFCVGEHHYKELSEYKKNFNLDKIELFKGGYPKLDELIENFNVKQIKTKKNKISIAPSWGEKNLIHYDLEKFFSSLIRKNFEIIFRPHYQMFKYNSKKLKYLKRKYGKETGIFFEESDTSFKNILNSEFLITDWSGIGIEYAFITGNPVIYVNTKKKINNVSFNDINHIPIEIDIRDKIGIILEPEELKDVDLHIEKLRLNLDYYKRSITEQKNKHIYNLGSSTEYISTKLLNF